MALIQQLVVYSRILSYVESEWAGIRRAPLALLIVTSVGGGIGWLLASQHYEGLTRELGAARDTAEQRRAYAQEQIADLQSQLTALGQKPQLHNTQESYTIRTEDEAEFVQSWRTITRISDIEIAHTKEDKKSGCPCEKHI